MSVRTGCDRLLPELRHLVAGRRVGLLCNQTAVDRSLIHLALRLQAALDVELWRLLAPEHGVWGTEQDMVPVGETLDSVLGLEVASLYGDSEGSLRPDPQALDGLDVLVFDIQDVGARYYTFVYSLMLAMEACAEAGVAVVVLDRPNPLGGEAVEGNVVQPAFASFVGLHPLAVRHGMTAGELAGLFKHERRIDVDLTVVPMDGWRRRMAFEDTGLPWVMPSPNMPSVETAWVYPGMCLLEGTNLSEGRGTTRPFELFGAPWVDPLALARALEAERLPGVAVRPARFRPTFQKHAGQVCGGVQLHVTDRRAFRSLRTGIAVLACARRLHPEQFRWRTERYEMVTDRLAIDLLFGTDKVRQALEAGADADTIEAAMEPEREELLERRAPHLLYEA